MNPENFDDGVTHVAKSFKAEVTNTQKLERLKEIEKKINNWKIKLRNSQDGSNREIQCNCRILDLKQKANKIGEELIGCERLVYRSEDMYCGDTTYSGKKCFCLTCKKANEILARINNG